LDNYTNIGAPVTKIVIEYEELIVTWNRDDCMVQIEDKDCVVT
jgi:hypothetical protein